MTNESSANAIIGNTLRIIASGEYHPGAELTQKMASYIIELEQKLTDMAVQLANAESKCRELAAENARLKSAHPQPFGPEMMKALDAYEKHQDEVPETGMLNAFFILRDSIRVETPATDVFLAEVRAQGVDALAQTLEGLVAVSVTRSYIMEFAAQLRKGAAL